MIITKYSRDEYETILSYSHVDQKWKAWTNIPSAMNKFEKQGWNKTKELRYADGSVESCYFEAPKAAITIGKAARAKRTLSEEHKEKLIAAAKAAKGVSDGV